MLLATLLCIVFLAWIVARIWKSNASLAVLTVFLWPVMVYALLRFWGDDKSDIKVPFLLFVPAAACSWIALHS